jgi:hypothetical protein
MKTFKTLRVDEGTNARQRGEVQSPRSQKEYDRLSPKDKKLVDDRIKRAFKQSISANPGESPRNKKKKINTKIQDRERRRSLARHGHITSGDIAPSPSSAADIEEAKTMGGILRKVKKGTPPYTVVAMVKGKVVDQQVARVAAQVPAIITEFQGGGSGATDLGSKHGGEVKIAVEDKDSRVVYSEQYVQQGINENVLMVHTQKTPKGDFRWLLQTIKYGKNTTVASGTESSRAKAMTAGKKAKKAASKQKGMTPGVAKNRKGYGDHLASQQDEARSSPGYKMPQSKDPYTVKYSARKNGPVKISVVDGKKAALKFVKDIKKQGMNGIIVKGNGFLRNEEIEEGGMGKKYDNAQQFEPTRSGTRTAAQKKKKKKKPSTKSKTKEKKFSYKERMKILKDLDKQIGGKGKKSSS